LNSLLDLSELNEKVGQLFMAGIPGLYLDEDTIRLIRDFNLGGIVLFSRNIEDPLQLSRLCHDIQKTAIAYHAEPLFIAVDQEGGRVARLREPFTIFSGNEAIGLDKNPIERAKEFGTITAREMRTVGLNMNLAPVLDVRRGNTDKHLMGRTFSEDHEKVALLGSTVVRTLQENGIMAVAKHFPGLGCADIDPHFYLPRIDLDSKEIHEINIPPFRSAIKEKVAGIMTSHALYPSLDRKNPATLSPIILNSLLRKKIGYKGLILTDDLEMGAIAEERGVAEGSVAAFKAGADILLICEDQSKVLESITFIRDRILQQEISGNRLNESIARIKKVRSKLPRPGTRVPLKSIEKYFKLN
jgi:beta-N-acetylhexosaminidase